MMYITAVSGVMVATGVYIRNYTEDLPDFIELLFVGGFQTTFFWV